MQCLTCSFGYFGYIWDQLAPAELRAPEVTHFHGLELGKAGSAIPLLLCSIDPACVGLVEVMWYLITSRKADAKLQLYYLLCVPVSPGVCVCAHVPTAHLPNGANCWYVIVSTSHARTLLSFFVPLV